MKKKFCFAVISTALAIAAVCGFSACGDEPETVCTEHQWDSGKVTREATCEEYGETTYTCTICNTTKPEPITQLAEHTWNDGEVYQPDLSEEGTITYTCKVCGETNTETVPAHTEHEWDEGAQIEAPTCAQKGVMKYECKICHTIRREDIDFVDHSLVLRYDDARHWLACTECSYTEDGEVHVSEIHTNDEQHWVACKTCDYVSEKTEHEFTQLIESSATCGSAGVGIFQCSGCDETEERTEQATGVHSFTLKEHKQMPTCIEKGIDLYECGVCHTTEERETEIDPNAHDFAFKANAQEATCSEKGRDLYECTLCRNAIEYRETAIDPNAHVLHWIYSQRDSEKHYQACSNCDYTTELVAHGENDWTETDRQAADCVTDGWIEYTCICGATKRETLPAAGRHNFTTLIETKTPATCGAAGVGVYQCTGCFETTELPISATGDHHFTEFLRNETEPTCIAKGVAVYKCRDCEATEERETEIDESAHNYETKSNDTQHYLRCTRCNVIDENSYTDHVFGEYEIEREATYYATGVRYHACECGYTRYEGYELDGFVSDYRSGIATENTSGWVYGHSDYNWNAPTEGRLPGSTGNNESFVFTESTEFNGDAWLVKNENGDVISEMKAGWLSGSWSTMVYTVGAGSGQSYVIALGYRYTPNDAHAGAYTKANVRIAVLSHDGTCKYSEFVGMDGTGAETTRTINGLNEGDKIYVFIEFATSQSAETNGWSWTSGDFTCRLFKNASDPE